MLIDQSQVLELTQVFWMFLGDLNGALLGAYLMKAIIDYLEKKASTFQTLRSPETKRNQEQADSKIFICLRLSWE